MSDRARPDSRFHFFYLINTGISSPQFSPTFRSSDRPTLQNTSPQTCTIQVCFKIDTTSCHSFASMASHHIQNKIPDFLNLRILRLYMICPLTTILTFWPYFPRSQHSYPSFCSLSPPTLLQPQDLCIWCCLNLLSFTALVLSYHLGLSYNGTSSEKPSLTTQSKSPHLPTVTF